MTIVKYNSMEPSIDQPIKMVDTVYSVCQKIQNYNFSLILVRLVNIDGWKLKEAQAAIAQYRNYLCLLKRYPNKCLPPSKDIDAVWHTHILHTKEYRQFCKTCFAEREDSYLDHHPSLPTPESLSNLEKAYKETQKLYKQEFGSYIYQITGKNFLEKLADKIREYIVKKFPSLIE